MSHAQRAPLPTDRQARTMKIVFVLSVYAMRYALCDFQRTRVDYESGSGLRKFKYDVTYYGPEIGLVLKF